MFQVTYRPKSNRDKSKVELFNSPEETGKFIHKITGSVDEANSTTKWCKSAKVGSKVTRQPNYKIECIDERELKTELSNIADKICNQLRITRSSAFFDNDDAAITVNIEPGLSFIKYHPNYGYRLAVNKFVDRELHELFKTTSRNKEHFIETAVQGIREYFPEYDRAISRFIVGEMYLGVNGIYVQQVIIHRRTNKCVYYETSNGVKGRAIIKVIANMEYIEINKGKKLVLFARNTTKN